MSLGHRDGPWLYWRQFLTLRSFLFDCPKVNNLTEQCFPVTCCTFPKNLETFKNSKAPFIMFCFKTTIKEYNFPTPEACRKYENAHSCKKSLPASLVALWADSSPLVMLGEIFSTREHFLLPTPPASGSSILLYKIWGHEEDCSSSRDPFMQHLR